MTDDVTNESVLGSKDPQNVFRKVKLLFLDYINMFNKNRHVVSVLNRKNSTKAALNIKGHLTMPGKKENKSHNLHFAPEINRMKFSQNT